MMNLKSEFFKLFVRISLTGGLLFLCSTPSQAILGRFRLSDLIQEASKKKGGTQLNNLANQIGISLDEVDPRLIRQIRETGALENPMRLFSQPSSSDHPFTFKNIFYGPDESDETLLSVSDETWRFANGFFLIRTRALSREQVRLFFEGMRDFANRHGDTVDMDEAGAQLIYGTKYVMDSSTYEAQIGHLVESVVRWYGPEIQESGGALEKLVESAWYRATTSSNLSFLFPRDDDSISEMLNNPFYETLLRRHFESIMLLESIPKTYWTDAWTLASIFAKYDRKNPRTFLLESIEGVIRTRLREALSGNHGKEAVEKLFETDYKFQLLFEAARENRQFRILLEKVISDFM